jgi:hypothetical protein
LFPRLLHKNVDIKIHKNIISPGVLCGCVTWYPTLREEHRLRVFEDEVLSSISGPKGKKVAGCSKLHDKDIHNLYSSSNISVIKRG